MLSIGQYVKRLREVKGLNQKDLVEKGVLNQPQLSKIERDIQDPNIDQLKFFSDIFHVSIESLIDIMDGKGEPLCDNQLQYKDDTICDLRRFVRYHHFHELEYTLHSIEKHPLFTAPVDSQFITWHKGILANELYGDIEKAQYFFDQAISSRVSPKLRERYVEILISKGVAYINQNKPKLALPPLQEALRILRSLYRLNDYKIATRLFYNLSLLSYQLENFKESTHYIEEAKSICFQNESSYLIGEIHFQYGLNQVHLKNLDIARKNMQIAYFHFEQYSQDKHLLYVCETIDKYKLK